MENNLPGAEMRRLIIWVGGVHGTTLFEAQLDAWRKIGYEIEEWQEVHEDSYRRSRGVSRLWFRVRLNCVFPLRVIARMLWSRREAGTIIVVPSTPFFAPAMIGLLKRRSERVVQILYDLYPDALTVAGKIRAGSLLERWFGHITARGMRKSDASVFLGKRLQAHAVARYGTPPLSVVIPTGTHGASLQHIPSDNSADAQLTVLYAGNLGYMHDVETVAAMLRLGLPKTIKLVFHSSGVGYEYLKRLAHEWPDETRARVAMSGPISNDEWARTMGDAQIGLILLAPGAEKVSFPSKTFSAMAAGQAIVAVAPTESDLCDLVRSENCGWVVEPGDADGLRAVFQRLVEYPEDLAVRRQASRCAGLEKYDLKVLAPIWERLFSRLS